MADANGTSPRAIVFGVSGPILSARERRLFTKVDPLGFILFARNCVEPEQVRTLIGDLREAVGWADAPVLIDQEGGRVQRLKPPHWRSAPTAARLAELARMNEAAAVQAAWLNARLIACELALLGVTVNCAPVLDVPEPGAHPVIGDRAFGRAPDLVALLGRATCEGLLDGGVLPVIKHIPGHGRATVDSHVDLPVVTATREELERVDFRPFQELGAMPWAMTAHVVYAALDPSSPATTSRQVIERVIRGVIGIQGVLLSDDLGMGALGGSPAERATAALAAGCDVALHCSGAIDEMEEVASTCPPLTPGARARVARAERMRRRPRPFDAETAALRLDSLLNRTLA